MKQVVELFGISKYNTVSSIIEREKLEIDIDKGLKNRGKHYMKKSSRFKGRNSSDPLRLFYSFIAKCNNILYTASHH
ncbi:MAG: hypothetical protein JXL81_01540 [Deltaproteobacteria bacterium]|nr:hypothetical protein [Deltaproteobacteria bacterium]